ncbi:hypothetical protein B484DRAFT_286609 [Ochromonadaceae sp. CCMP2298]|nr:hypothetical protein B484DRAFT_286609 [Ochromonadaceae sp. CCMP2298]
MGQGGGGGEEIDPLMCAAFRIVSRFVPGLVSARLNALEGERKAEVEEEQTILQETYLWHSIYPKLAGKPCYNPSGKYAVRLYLSSKWRKVYVDDKVPLREDGSPALACSADSYELWPLLIAKAVYTVFSACGYTANVPPPSSYPKTLPVRLEEDGEESTELDPTQLCRPQCDAVTSAFFLHLLTGWQPRAPISLSHTFTHELTKASKLLNAFAAEGVCTIAEVDIVRDRGGVRRE